MQYVNTLIFSFECPFFMFVADVGKRLFTVAPSDMCHSKNARIVWFAKVFVPVCIVIGSLTIFSTGLVYADTPSVELRHLGFVRDKNWNAHLFSVTMSNHSDQPLWIILPWSGDKPLPEKPIFPNDKIIKEPLNKITLDDNKSEMVATGVSFGSTFKAFYLPAHAELEIPQYKIGSRLPARKEYTSSKAEFNEIVIVDAKELLVNGKNPLEKWLPFTVGIYKAVKPSENMNNHTGVRADNEDKQPQNAQEKVENIEAKGSHRWTVKFQPKDEFDREQRNQVDLNSTECRIHLDSSTSRNPHISTDRIAKIDRMIDAIASRNKPPVLVHANSNEADSLLVPRDPYDWSEQDRVQKAIRAVQDDKSDEMWRRLHDHYGDKRYALTLVFDGALD